MSAASSESQLDARISEATQAALPAILLDARRAAAAIVMGTHGKRRAGSGDAFWQHREWTNGESTRQIDWRRSARSDRLFVREREWQVPAHLQIWADQRETMDWSSATILPTKAEHGLVIALALAFAAQAGGERVSALTQGAQSHGGRANGHKANSIALTNEIAFARHLVDNGVAPPSAYGPGQVLIISDGLESAEMWANRARDIVASKAALIVVLVADPAERDFPFQGRVEFQGSQQDAPLIVGRAQSARFDYQDAYRSHIEAVSRAITSAGGLVFQHLTDQTTLPLLLLLAGELSGSSQPMRAARS